MELQVDIAQDALAMIDYNGRSRLLLISEKEPGQQFVDAAEAAGFEVVARVSLQDAEERLAEHIGLNAVWLELNGAEATGADSLFERLQAAAENARFRSIICFPRELIDAVAARASHPEVCLLCNPTDRDVASALSSAVVQKPLTLHDVSRRRGSPGLQQISQEVGRIASMLAEMSEAEASGHAPARPSNAPLHLEAAHVRAIYRARRVREQYFESDLFADPAWDMMLDLMLARLERRLVSVSSLCIAAAVPPTTALRWIKTLTDAGVFVRTPDPSDGRRIYMTLSDEAAERMEACLLDAQRNAGLLM